MTGSTQDHFDRVAADYDRWKEKAHYYYGFVKQALAEVVPPGSRVCEMGCGTGDLLASLEPVDGLGTDLSPEMIARARVKHPGLRFEVHDLMREPLPERFDYIVSVDVAEHVPDLNRAMKTMAAMLEEGGTLVLITPNPSWRWILEIAERLKLKMPEGSHEWRTREDLVRAARDAGLEHKSFDRGFIVPKELPGLHRLNTADRAKRMRDRFGLMQRSIFVR